MQSSVTMNDVSGTASTAPHYLTPDARLLRAGAVIVASTIAWSILWAVGAAAVGAASVIAPLLPSHSADQPAFQLGYYAQWMYATASLALLVGVATDRLRAVRWAGCVWLVTALLMAVLGHVAFGDNTILAGAVGVGLNGLVLAWLWPLRPGRAA